MGWILILAEIILGFGFCLFAIGYMIFKIIPLSIKLLRIRIKKARKYVEEYEAEEKKEKEHKKQTKQYNQWTNNWMHNANARQNNRYEYTDPKWSTNEMKWSPTGWYWDDKKKEWIPPDYMNAKANTKIPTVYLTPEEKELAKQIKVDHSRPSFEEWKAEQYKAKTSDGAYRRDYFHIEQDETATKKEN